MSEICESGRCTLCKLCINVCPKQCIRLDERPDGDTVACKDDDICIECGLCELVCPSLNVVDCNYPKKVYAAWTSDSEIHKVSASGGIAAQMYKETLEKGWYIVGCEWNEDFEAVYKITSDIEDIAAFQNSKYVYSNPSDIYLKVRDIVKEGKSVLFIGLPCHVAAMASYATRFKFRDKILLVDLACHGTPPAKYFKQHIDSVKKQLERNVTRCFFRDPKFGTDKFFFTLYDGDNLIYKKRVNEDLYCFGYHKALIYRECCYECRYAKRERCSDLTISDYHGLGTLTLYTGNRKSVSCILVNTEMGETFLKALNNLIKYERPIEEPLRIERVFNQPYQKKPEVDLFKKDFSMIGDYGICARKIFQSLSLKARNENRNISVILRNFMEFILPNRIKFVIKKIVKKIIL